MVLNLVMNNLNKCFNKAQEQEEEEQAQAHEGNRFVKRVGSSRTEFS